MLARRIEIAKRLIKEQSYGDISSQLKVGTDTICRVQRWLTSGFGGYEKAINDFKKELDRRFDKSKKISREIPYSFDWIKQKYPLHFLLFNLLSSSKNTKK